ncbi:MAG: hypothetical protein H6Q39_1718 [Chloroflexi bacterium]|nr:hypothetical protein [Chloroflexota bacterium]
MADNNRESAGNDFITLEYSIRELESTLARYVSYLDKHISGMEELNRAILQLESTIRQQGVPGSQGPSDQLQEAVTSLMKSHINPRYYKDMAFLQLSEGGPQPPTVR